MHGTCLVVKSGLVAGNWETLTTVWVPMLRYQDQSIGYMMVDMAYTEESQMHILAFESRKDAEAAKNLYQANIDPREALVGVVPMKPDKLKEVAEYDRSSITVYRPGQLKLKPGMTERDLAGAAAGTGSAFESMQEEVLSQIQ